MGWFSGLIGHFGSYVPWTTQTNTKGISTSDTEDNMLNEINVPDESPTAFPGQPTTHEALVGMFQDKVGSLRAFLIRTKDLAGFKEVRTTGQNAVSCLSEAA